MELSTMDRPISANQLLRRRVLIILSWLGGILLLAGLVSAVRTMIRPTLEADQFETATVEYGLVSETISCTGTLELESRRMILSPATAVLQETKASPGQLVQSGDTILILDQAGIRKQLSEMQLELKTLENRLQKQSLAASITRLEIEHQRDLNKMEIERLQSVWKDEKTMLSMGGTPPEKVEQAKQAVDLARKELDITSAKNKLKLAELEVTEEELQLERQKLLQKFADLRAQSQQLWVLAPIPGVVISIDAEIGSMIQQNQELVKISDLRTYKITGKINEKFSAQLSSGGRVNIIIDQDQSLEGTIGNIRPVVESGQVYFDVLPVQKDHPRFRPNLEVELRILVAEKSNTLRLKDGPFYDGSKKLKVFKVENNRAVATEITTGLTNMNYIEIENGLEEGDEVVISDVSDFQHLEWIEIE